MHDLKCTASTEQTFGSANSLSREQANLANRRHFLALFVYSSSLSVSEPAASQSQMQPARRICQRRHFTCLMIINRQRHRRLARAKFISIRAVVFIERKSNQKVRSAEPQVTVRRNEGYLRAPVRRQHKLALA